MCIWERKRDRGTEAHREEMYRTQSKCELKGQLPGISSLLLTSDPRMELSSLVFCKSSFPYCGTLPCLDLKKIGHKKSYLKVNCQKHGDPCVHR